MVVTYFLYYNKKCKVLIDTNNLLEVIIMSEISTHRYRRPLLSTYDIERYKYRIVANYKQEGTGTTTTRIKVERCFLGHEGVWEDVELTR